MTDMTDIGCFHLIFNEATQWEITGKWPMSVISVIGRVVLSGISMLWADGQTDISGQLDGLKMGGFCLSGLQSRLHFEGSMPISAEKVSNLLVWSQTTSKSASSTPVQKTSRLQKRSGRLRATG
jgi:hypothetical protein